MQGGVLSSASPAGPHRAVAIHGSIRTVQTAQLLLQRALPPNSQTSMSKLGPLSQLCMQGRVLSSAPPARPHRAVAIHGSREAGAQPAVLGTLGPGAASGPAFGHQRLQQCSGVDRGESGETRCTAAGLRIDLPARVPQELNNIDCVLQFLCMKAADVQVAAINPQGVCILDSNMPEEDICVLKDFSSSPAQLLRPSINPQSSCWLAGRSKHHTGRVHAGQQWNEGRHLHAEGLQQQPFTAICPTEAHESCCCAGGGTPQGVCMLDSNVLEGNICMLKDFTPLYRCCGSA